ncbi:hypothetical protein [Sinorhizobium medicae]
MPIPNYSDAALAEQHTAVAQCLFEDDSASPWRDWEYGVRSQRDWSIHRDEIEAELTRREIPFMPIVW